jgi:hypothetical protein
MVWPGLSVGVCFARPESGVVPVVERESRWRERKLELNPFSVAAREKSGLFKGITTSRQGALAA